MGEWVGNWVGYWRKQQGGLSGARVQVMITSADALQKLTHWAMIAEFAFKELNCSIEKKNQGSGSIVPLAISSH